MVLPDDSRERFIDAYISKFVIPGSHDVGAMEKAAAFFRSIHPIAHRVRYLETYDRIRRLVDTDGKVLAETGVLSGPSRYFEARGEAVRKIEGDFRYRLNAPDSSVDVLFSFEVFEHIKDQDSKSISDIGIFNFSGVRTFAAEMCRVIKPAGKLVMTTPNACSLIAVTRLLNNEPPMLFYPHVKEYAPKHVIEICTDAGLRLAHFDTMYACSHFHDRTALLAKHFTQLGASPENRGDIAFYIFEKS